MFENLHKISLISIEKAPVTQPNIYSLDKKNKINFILFQNLEEVGRAPRLLDVYSTGRMKEDGVLKAAAPECKGQLGWVYHNGHCYMFTSYHLDFLKAEEECNKVC